MRRFLTLVLLLTSTLSHAETIQDRIHSIEEGLIKFQNGRVAFTNSSLEGLERDVLLSANLDENGKLLSFIKLDYKRSEALRRSSFLFEEEDNAARFSPSILPNRGAVQKIFDNSNPYYKRVSECSDLAHVWAHDEFKRSGVKSQKAFVFFTSSYINSVGFKWWFHVAPMYSVKINGKVQQMVSDFRYMPGPATVKEWTDSFVYTKRPCKLTTKFSEYDENPQTENCYLIYESMHYKLPGEIYNQERYGTYKNSTSESEIEYSRNLGFLKNTARD